MMEFPLGFDVVTIVTGTRATIRAVLRADIVGYVPTRLLMPSSVAGDLVIELVVVDGRRVFEGQMPAATFGEDRDPAKACEMVRAWGRVTKTVAIALRNTGRGTTKATASMLGTIG